MAYSVQSESSVGILTCLIVGPLLYFAYCSLPWLMKLRAIASAVDKLPGPPKHWLHGNFGQIVRVGEASLLWSRDMASKYKSCYRLWLGPFRARVVLVSPDNIKTLLETSEPKPTFFSTAYNFIRSWIGDGLITVTDKRKWLRNRRLLTPAFHFDVLKSYVSIKNKAADVLIRKLMEAQSTQKSVEIFQPVGLCTLDILLKCAFSSQEDVQGIGETHPYASAVIRLNSLVKMRSWNPWLANDLVYYSTAAGKQCKELCDYVHQVSADVIAKRKKTLETSSKNSERRHPDFLDILLMARDEDGAGMTDAEIGDEVDTFMFAGHDTTASAISWMLYTLALHPDAQQRCREEVRAFLAGRETPEIRLEDTSRLPFLTVCMKESLRLHPPVPSIGRDLSQPMTVAGVTLPTGTEIGVDIYAANHNKHVWGDDHMEFKPERFEAMTATDRDNFAYVPFSAGPRNCIGQRFAKHEITIVVGKILHRLKISVDVDHPVLPQPELVMKAKDGIKLIFQAADDQ